MSNRFLTPDNSHLSRPTTREFEAGNSSAINCTDWSDRVADLVRDSLSENTRRAYLSDLDHFRHWGGELPTTPAMVAEYLADHADLLSVATLSRRLASLSKAHAAKGHPSPASSELVKATMRGIKRQRGTTQKEAKPLLKEDLFQVLAATGETTKDLRDRSLLLLGFAGGFRRSELVGLDHGDIEHVRQGLVITLRRSKTDQLGAGRKIGIPLGRSRWCPVAALDNWLASSGIADGPLFRPVNRHGHLASERLSGEAVSLVIRERLLAAGYDPTGFSGHSLRAGFATSAAQAGISTIKIRAQTGHSSDAMLARYVRDGELFVGNAVSLLL